MSAITVRLLLCFIWTFRHYPPVDELTAYAEEVCTGVLFEKDNSQKGLQSVNDVKQLTLAKEPIILATGMNSLTELLNLTLSSYSQLYPRSRRVH